MVDNGRVQQDEPPQLLKYETGILQNSIDTNKNNLELNRIQIQWKHLYLQRKPLIQFTFNMMHESGLEII